MRLSCTAAALLRALALALVLATLAGCAHVPVVDDVDLAKAADGSQIKVFGARGPPLGTAVEGSPGPSRRAGSRRWGPRAPSGRGTDRPRKVPCSPATKVRVLRDGAETFPAMFAAIRQATRYVYLEYYIFEDVACDGEMLSDLLTHQSQAGVHVRVIYGRDRLHRHRLGLLRQAPGCGHRGHRIQSAQPVEAALRIELTRSPQTARGGRHGGDHRGRESQLDVSKRPVRRRGNATRTVWHDTDIEGNRPRGTWSWNSCSRSIGVRQLGVPVEEAEGNPHANTTPDSDHLPNHRATKSCVSWAAARRN